MSIQLDFENASTSQTPDKGLFLQWIGAALADVATTADSGDAELSVRIVDEAEMIELNHRFRNKDQTTNVLSFPADVLPELEIALLGDIAICAAVIEREAQQQGKSLDAHYAHISIHGALHLAGYDHIKDSDAEQMEALEIRILKSLGYNDPYHYKHHSQGDKLPV